MSQTKFTTINKKYTGPGGKVTGILYGDVLRKSIYGSRHFLRTPPGIAIDVNTLDQGEADGASKVEVVDQESGTVYSATIEHLHRAGIPIDRGWGRQLVLPFSGWVKKSKGAPVQLALLPEVQP